MPRAVWLLGLGSLFTDTASEAIYPLLPLFLTTVLGAGAVSLGLIEGAAEAASSLLKIISGRLSDRWNRRRPIVIVGYSLSSLMRPLIGLATAWPQVMAVRFVDRVGKGIRGAPRDALLAAVATAETRGRVFGFHRAMDHAGAVLGPLLATLFLLAYPGRYRTLFLLTIVPGAVAVLMFFLVREAHLPPRAPSSAADHRDDGPAEAAWRRLPARFYVFLSVLLIFALGNSADAFLLLRLTDLGVRPAFIPLLWAAHHVVKAAVSVVGGVRSDRLGRRRIIGAGWIIYAVVYAGFALTTSAPSLIGLFMVYGCYYGLAEGTEKALIADLAPADLRGTAFGLYYAMLGIGGLLASVVFGLIWRAAGAAAAFSTGAVLAVVATALLFTFVRDERVA
jgi:MFS family permease